MTKSELTEFLAEKLRDHLHRFYEASALTPEQIAERAEMTEAELQAVLAKSSKVQTMEELLVVLYGLDIPPDRFFGDLFGSTVTALQTRILAIEEELLDLGALNRERLDARIEQCRFRRFE